MGGALFEGLIVAEAWKAYCNLGRKPSAYFWRSQGGLEVDLILQAQGKLWPIEIKLTATPGPGHLTSLNHFKQLAGNESADQGVIVCRVGKRRPLPNNNFALPWGEFNDWLQEIVS